MFPSRISLLAAAGALTLGCFSVRANGIAPSLQPLRVSDNRRFLVTASGQPFFWLGDTAWHMFGKSSREETTNQPAVSLYFSNRAAKGFTVIQSVIVRWPEGGSSANAYGFEPFENGDWSRPRLRPGPNDDYWDHVDWCIAEAKRHGLYVAGLPLWLSAIEDNNSMVRDPRVAYRYGHFLGTRYGKEPHIIWVLGGDAYQKGRNVDQPARLAMIRAQAEGIAEGANGVVQFDGQADWKTTLMTFHPPGGNHSSSEWLHAEPWLDFNMVQTTTRFTFENWRTVAKDYALQPPKPTFDAEVAYEGSLSLSQTEPQDRRIRPWDVRRAAYWNVFAGGLGHTYGHRSFIGWIRQGETYRYGAHIPWFESLDAPGAVQMGHLRRLMESRPLLSRIPDQSLLTGEVLTGDEHLQATRDADGTYAMVYSPSGRSFKVRMDKIAGPKVKAWWFNPRMGEATVLGEFANSGEREFAPPTSGAENDWVLVMDDASKDVPPPGRAMATMSSAPPDANFTRSNAISVRWEKRVLTDKYYCDGIHCGDFNRDGRMDVVAGPFWYEGPEFQITHEIYPAKEFPKPPSPTDSLYSFVHDFNRDGWWERPAADAKQTDWIAHRFKFAAKGGAQMFAYDVDGDGDNDIITTLDAHGWGLAWFEQVKEGGKLTFREHKIMGDRSEESTYGLAFSQPHALDLADIDGDGLKDIIVGKRLWAHGPKGDIEPEAAPVLYWFQLTRGPAGQVRYVPRFIDNQSGVGCQVVAADMTGDGRPDILTVSKLGAFVFINRPATP